MHLLRLGADLAGFRGQNEASRGQKLGLVPLTLRRTRPEGPHIAHSRAAKQLTGEKQPDDHNIKHTDSRDDDSESILAHGLIKPSCHIDTPADGRILGETLLRSDLRFE